ncbi:hypothetical protein C8Q80DRAFT_1272664 [Daedaleopsis nitida]|nr:hypothetical protein C8Q80DRAFT_1272664 [Daedaleopsis nitida]
MDAMLTTPLRRKSSSSSLSTTHNGALDEASVPPAPAPFTACVVTWASPGTITLEESHVVDPDTLDEELDKLEWSWDMIHLAFDVNTWMNIQPLNVTLHDLFNQRTKNNKHTGWFWLPDDQNVLLQMYTYYLDTTQIPVPIGHDFPNKRCAPD